MRKVTAGTIFSVAEAKVGEVLSKPNRYNPWLHVILPVPKTKTVRQILGILYSPILLLFIRLRSYPTNPRRKNCTKNLVVNGGLSFLYTQKFKKFLGIRTQIFFLTFPCNRKTMNMYNEILHICSNRSQLLTSLENMQKELVQTVRWCFYKEGKLACLHPY